jgi:hypothetical protein
MSKSYKNQISLIITTINKSNKFINKYLDITKKIANNAQIQNLRNGKYLLTGLLGLF